MGFSVQIINNKEIVDFLSRTPTSAGCYLDDEGVEISPPEYSNEYVATYKGDVISQSRATKRQILLKFSILAVNQQDIGTTIAKINRMVNRSTTKFIVPVAGAFAQLVMEFPGSTDKNYSRILTGTLELPNFIYGVSGLLQKVVYDGRSYYILRGCTLVLECLPYVARQNYLSSYTTLQQIPLSTPQNTQSLGPVWVYNSWEHGSTTKYNGVNFGDLEIYGDVPLPYFINFHRNGYDAHKTYIFHSEIASASTRDLYSLGLEGESYTDSGYLDTESTPSDTNCSYGQYLQFTLLNTQKGASSTYVGWDFSGIAAPERGVYRAIARFRNAINSGVVVYGGLQLQDVEEIGEKVINVSGGYYLDLGIFNMPFGLADVPNMGWHQFNLHFDNQSGADRTIQLDAVYLFNQSCGFRLIETPDDVIKTELYDDAWKDVVYANYSSLDYPLLKGYFSPIEITPGMVEQRLSFMFTVNGQAINRNMTFDVYLYVPNLFSFFN